MKKLFLLAFLAFLSSCGEEAQDVSIDPGYHYFPLRVNESRTYEVEEVTIEAFIADTNSYYLKEVIVDSLISGDGSKRYLINRYKSLDQDSWELDSVWSARKTDVVAVITENDVAYCKMVFPVKEGRTWDGNSFNTQPPQEYRYEPISGYENGDLVIAGEALIRVVIEDIPQNLVNQDERSEVYGSDIGLVQKEYVQLSFCTLNCEEKGSSVGEIEKGRVLSQKLIAYGEE